MDKSESIAKLGSDRSSLTYRVRLGTTALAVPLAGGAAGVFLFLIHLATYQDSAGEPTNSS